MRLNYIVLPLLLTACASPQERCISDANRELTIINDLVNETKGNVARGFAVGIEEEVIVRRGLCDGETEDGIAIKVACDRTITLERRVPVAIDLNAERAKLASLIERQNELQSKLNARVDQCRAQFPES